MTTTLEFSGWKKFEVTQLTFGPRHAGSVGTKFSWAGKGPGDCGFVRKIDRDSSLFLEHASEGTEFHSVIAELASRGERHTVTLEKVTIGGYNASSGDEPLESIWLAFKNVKADG